MPNFRWQDLNFSPLHDLFRRLGFYGDNLTFIGGAWPIPVVLFENSCRWACFKHQRFCNNTISDKLRLACVYLAGEFSKLESFNNCYFSASICFVSNAIWQIINSSSSSSWYWRRSPQMTKYVAPDRPLCFLAPMFLIPLGVLLWRGLVERLTDEIELVKRFRFCSGVRFSGKGAAFPKLWVRTDWQRPWKHQDYSALGLGRMVKLSS